MLPLAVAKQPEEGQNDNDSQLNLAQEAVFVILVVIKDSDLQYFMHIADIPEMLTNSLAEYIDILLTGRNSNSNWDPKSC